MNLSAWATWKTDPKTAAPTSPATDDEAPGLSSASGPSRRQIAEHLRAVIDPEVGLNIVDLGLLYDVQIDGGEVAVRLTMTTPVCPMSSYIKQQVGEALRRVPGVRRGTIELVWDPAWSPYMIDPDIRSMYFPTHR